MRDNWTRKCGCCHWNCQHATSYLQKSCHLQKSRLIEQHRAKNKRKFNVTHFLNCLFFTLFSNTIFDQHGVNANNFCFIRNIMFLTRRYYNKITRTGYQQGGYCHVRLRCHVVGISSCILPLFYAHNISV